MAKLADSLDGPNHLTRRNPHCHTVWRRGPDTDRHGSALEARFEARIADTFEYALEHLSQANALENVKRAGLLAREEFLLQRIDSRHLASVHSQPILENWLERNRPLREPRLKCIRQVVAGDELVLTRQQPPEKLPANAVLRLHAISLASLTWKSKCRPPGVAKTG
jgi:hypothetical protein